MIRGGVRMPITLEEALAASEKKNAELAAGGAKAREEYDARHNRSRLIKNLKSKSLMDRKFYEATFENFQKTKSNTKQLLLCRRYAEVFSEMFRRNQGLLFYGDVGTGKTYMAACIANYLLSNSVSVVMTSFVQILSEAQPFGSELFEQGLAEKLNKAKLLIIDDLGAERSTDYALERVYGVIDSRYRAQKPMILTTNMTLEKMQVATDIRYSRIYDRIFEVCYPVEFRGKSWRRKKAANRFDEMTRLWGVENEN